MARFSASGLTYPEACELIRSLRTAGIEANITAGGISIHCEPDRVNDARAICDERQASFDAGYTSHQEDVMMRSKSGCEKLAEITNDAIAVIKEWK